MQRILVVDDDAHLRDLLADVLRHEGYEVETAVHGQQGLERVRAWRPDALVTDLHMPFMDGWTLIASCRAELGSRSLRILVVSSAAAQALALEALGVAAHLTKPVDVDALVRTLDHILRPMS